MFFWLLGLKRWWSVLGNKDNLHLISLGCSAGNNGRCSCVAQTPAGPGLNGCLCSGLGQQECCSLGWSSVSHRQEVGRERKWVLGKPTPSLLLSRGGVQQPWDALKRKQLHPPVAALWSWGQCLYMLLFTSPLHWWGGKGLATALPRELWPEVVQE